MRAPDRRASLSAMATACLRLRTLRPEDERSEPRLYSRITFRTFRRPRRALAIRPYLLGYLLAWRTVSSFLTDLTPATPRACSEALADARMVGTSPVSVTTPPSVRTSTFLSCA